MTDAVREQTPIGVELGAITGITAALDGLTPDAQQRVIRWAAERYGGVEPSHGPEVESGAPPEQIDLQSDASRNAIRTAIRVTLGTRNTREAELAHAIVTALRNAVRQGRDL